MQTEGWIARAQHSPDEVDALLGVPAVHVPAAGVAALELVWLVDAVAVRGLHLTDLWEALGGAATPAPEGGPVVQAIQPVDEPGGGVAHLVHQRLPHALLAIAHLQYKTERQSAHLVIHTY